MGASNSKSEEDKSLQLCRARKKFIKQALNGRCSLAAAHSAYIEELKIIGAALRKFVEPDVLVEPLAYPVRSEPYALIEKSVTSLSSSSQPQSQHVDRTEDLLRTPSTRVSMAYEAHPMKFTETVSKKVEEKPSVPVVISVASTTPPLDNPPPWDYFGLFQNVENDYSEDGKRMFDQSSEFSDEIRHLREEEGIPDLENVHESLSSGKTEELLESEEEFDDPSPASLVRSFKNVNTVIKGDSNGNSSISGGAEAKDFSSDEVNERKVDVISGDSSIKHSESVVSKTGFANGEKDKSPDLQPSRNDGKITGVGGSELEHKVEPKDFFSSINDIEQLFVKASESGKEVPRMLEANKFHFRPVLTGRERNSLSLFLALSVGFLSMHALSY